LGEEIEKGDPVKGEEDALTTPGTLVLKPPAPPPPP
jgi:hypothetical protein